MSKYSLVHITDKIVSGHKVSKDRFTFMPYSNIDSSNKMRLVVIGK
ncbi:hypothetical protein A3Q56_08317 [Intoshia linei]|uniref:Uncharacterized protein n=1 Tax=Intoshia linei TaxID=1819745 RepID=A0A177APR3_9BILA|nr:hypothetical protein A3Q56_08317 [Intoshia linei]